MPLPVPRGDESQNAFISRCMSDGVMKSEYPDSKQRTAVCFSQFRKRNNSAFIIPKNI